MIELVRKGAEKNILFSSGKLKYDTHLSGTCSVFVLIAFCFLDIVGFLCTQVDLFWQHAAITLSGYGIEIYGLFLLDPFYQFIVATAPYELGWVLIILKI